MDPLDPSARNARANRSRKTSVTREMPGGGAVSPASIRSPPIKPKGSGQFFSSRCQMPALRAGGNQKTEFRRRKTLPASSSGFWLLISEILVFATNRQTMACRAEAAEAAARLRLSGYGVAASAAPQRRLVEPDGIEPTTSCLQSRRSPN